MASPDPLQVSQSDQLQKDRSAALERLLSLLDTLEQTLGHEVEAVAAGDVDALVAHTAAKRAMLRDLQTRMTPELASFQGEDAPELLARLQRCHALNQSNGAAINNALRHNSQVLSLLGHDSGPVVYAPQHSPSGGTANGGRSLASA